MITSPELDLKVTQVQSPAQFLYGDPGEQLVHDCIEVTEFQTKIRPDLGDQELQRGEKLVTDGSSRVVSGKRKPGYAIISGGQLEVKESGPLSPSWSAQACELNALLRASLILEGREGTIYMDSRYAFSVVHTFGKIWKERRLISTQGKGLVHERLIIQILEALKGPKRIAVVHVKGHQRGRDIRVREIIWLIKKQKE